MTQILEHTESSAIPSEDSDDDNVFALLAHQARDRNAGGLWTTAIGGAINATLIWRAHTSLHWLAAGFVAVAAYGVWGLADRALARRRTEPGRVDVPRDAVSAVRTLAIPAGVIAALAAVGGFMAAALGGWQH